MVSASRSSAKPATLLSILNFNTVPTGASVYTFIDIDPIVEKSGINSVNVSLLFAQGAPPLLTNCPTVALGLLASICGFGITVAIPPSSFIKSEVTTLDSNPMGKVVALGSGITGPTSCSHEPETVVK